MRRKFYKILVGVFPMFFMLHWNGLGSFTYYWALEARDATYRLGPQVTAALISSIVIFATISLVFELVFRFLSSVGLAGEEDVHPTRQSERQSD